MQNQSDMGSESTTLYVQSDALLTQIIPLSTKEDLRLMAEISTVNRDMTRS